MIVIFFFLSCYSEVSTAFLMEVTEAGGAGCTTEEGGLLGEAEPSTCPGGAVASNLLLPITRVEFTLPVSISTILWRN